MYIGTSRHICIQSISSIHQLVLAAHERTKLRNVETIDLQSRRLSVSNLTIERFFLYFIIFL